MTIDLEKLSDTEVAVKQTIDDLIQTATSYDVDALNRLYHDDLQVIMLDDGSGKVSYADKPVFMSMFQAKRAAGDAPMNTWAQYHHIQVDENRAHVLLSRKNDLSGEEKLLRLSIDLLHLDGRWQVVREVIVIRPV